MEAYLKLTDGGIRSQHPVQSSCPCSPHASHPCLSSLTVCFVCWISVDLEEYLNRAALRDVLKDTGEELLEKGIQAAFDYVLGELGIPMVS